MSDGTPWPAIAGTYRLGDPQAPVAVCALTSERLWAPLARVPGVAIAGQVYTANLGIERIVANVTANPAIRFLLLCGKDSPIFRPGQSLVALAEHGIDGRRRIVAAAGYDPVLPTLPPERVARFRRQVEVIDRTGEEDLGGLEATIRDLAARDPGGYISREEHDSMATDTDEGARFTPIRTGGRREPLLYDPKGYFVITVDRDEEQILLRHYLPDHTPAHEMRGRVAGSMLLGLLREGLVTQLSHAGYLGEELAKAEAALRLGLRYDQDRPLRHRTDGDALPAQGGEDTGSSAPAATSGAQPSMPPIPPSLTWQQLQAVAPGDAVQVVTEVTEQPLPEMLVGIFLEPDEAEPFSAFRRTTHHVRVHWTAATRIVMGGSADLRVGAILRAHGALSTDGQIEAELIAVTTHVARVVGM